MSEDLVKQLREIVAIAQDKEKLHEVVLRAEIEMHIKRLHQLGAHEAAAELERDWEEING